MTLFMGALGLGLIIYLFTSSEPQFVLRGLLGIAGLIGIAVLFSNNRSKIDWPLVLSGIVLQLGFACLVLKSPWVYRKLRWLSDGFVTMNKYVEDAAQLMFGGLMNVESYGFIFAFQVLPTIVFFAALSSLLYYLGILQRIVFVFAWIMSKTMRLSGAESLSAAGNIFVGQTESPLLIKPYLKSMTKSEMLCIMIGGMATIAGGVFVAYIQMLGGSDPVEQSRFAAHLLTASIISAPAAILAAKIMFPQNEEVDRSLKVSKDKMGANFLDAITRGTTEGVKLAVNVAAMLIVFTALVYLLNHFLMMFGDLINVNDRISAASEGKINGFNLQYILGWVFAPVAWLIGIAKPDVQAVGQLLGFKTILNEFFAYDLMGRYKSEGILTDPRSIMISTYAICGFANIASIGIQVGGIGVLAPSQRENLAKLGFKALIGGTLATLFTACIAGMIL